ncbi:tetratricopeptide repeat protein [Nonomuraea sp. NPDC048901]|uniref:tetratricopeptide repeat protein n=1 Tax=Nonomuraea sp. NPDC048901 TaxID=3155627 RepID=UPI0033C1AA13
MRQPQLSPISRMVVAIIAGIVLVPEVLRLLTPSADRLSVSRAALFTIPLALGVRTVRADWRAWPRLSPYVLAAPVALCLWLLREGLDAAAATEGTAVLGAGVAVLAGFRLVVEVPIALVLVGGLFSPDDSIFRTFAEPSLYAAMAGMAVYLLAFGAESWVPRLVAGGRWRTGLWLARLVAAPGPLVDPDLRWSAYSTLAMVHQSLNRPERAVRLRRWLSRLAGRRRDPAARWQALYDQAVAERQAGNPERALRVLGQARQAIGDAPGTPLERELGKIDLLGVEYNVRLGLGDIDAAVATRKAALDLIEAAYLLLPGVDPSARAATRRRIQEEHAQTLRTLGDLYSDHLLDYSGAAWHYRDAVKLAEDLRDPFVRYPLYHSVATLYARRERYAEAGEQFRQALALAESGRLGDLTTPSGSSARALALSGLANTARQQGDLDEAIRRYDEAIRAGRAIPGWNVPAATFLGAGAAHLEHGDTARAIELLRKALDGGLGESQIRITHLELGKAYEQAGVPRTAYDHYRRSIEMLERSRASMEAEQDQLHFYGWEPRVQVYERMVATCLALGRTVEAYDYVERAKARAMLEALGSHSSRR